MNSFDSSTEKLGDNVKDRRLTTRVLCGVSILLVVATVALSVALAVTVLRDRNDDHPLINHEIQHGNEADPLNTHNIQQGNGSESVCLTQGCVMAAARVLGAMDLTVNPCEDFFNFACGTWVRKHVIPEDKSAYGTFTQLRDDVDIILKSVFEEPNENADPDSVQKARNYYKACTNEAKVEELGLTFIHKYMEGFGGWPVMGSGAGGNWNSSSYSLENLLIYTRKDTNAVPLLDFSVSVDDKKPTAHIIYLDQPDLGMPSRDYYLKDRGDKTLMAYQTLLTDSAVAFGADRATAEKDMKDVVDMEIYLANITVPKEERRDPEKLYNKITLGNLKNNFTGVDWQKVIRGMMQHVSLSLDDSEPVIVIAPPFLEALGSLISKFPPRVIQNYIVGRRVLGKIFYLPEMFRDLNLKYQKVLSGTASEKPRWQSCSNSIRDTMPEVVGRLFVEKAFNKEAKADVLDLVGRLRTAFKGMIGNLDWMEEKTKQVAEEKADYIEPRIGYSEVVYNNTVLNKKYENLTVYVDDPLRTLISASEASVIRTLEDLRKPVDKTEWDISAAVVNAYYNPVTNQITFPAAILQPPFYSHDQPGYLNYGGIGYVIGHEITHGFDDQGRLYDKNGNLHNWWSDGDASRFKVRAQCIIDQYSNFTVPGTGGMTLNGVNTQGENIADNGGIKESFKAYKEWVAVSRQGKPESKLPGMSYTPEQLYFLNSAQVWCEKMRDEEKIERIRTDPHSLYMYRVYGPMQNFDEFSKAWSCPVGSFMNPSKRCSVW